ncbi:hypothetical protein LWI28_014934 [Acer negundo]|uniref:Uncharacterized protein n=1 Tax=Acer negundo TaxID=4023 RepID=A0AAD5JNP2_ACENE|nr:hypothetical protein LWI28_014934 [Acer negundo]
MLPQLLIRNIAAWHGWAVLELKQGNIKQGTCLLKVLNLAWNEYVYQTLALLEARATRYEQARNLFRQATKCNPKAVPVGLKLQASPKNRFAWHVGEFLKQILQYRQGKKTLKDRPCIESKGSGSASVSGLLEYKYSTANVARSLFRKASAWGWMEWKEGNISTAREYYQQALAINSTTESAARCLQAWGVLEQRVGNLSAARRLFRSSLNINSQSYVTWMTWAQLEDDQGNSVRAEEIRNLYFQQEPSRYNPGVNENAIDDEESVSPSSVPMLAMT